MTKSNNQDLEFPFWDPDPRRVLSTYSKEVKEESIKDEPHNKEQIEASPLMLALTIMILAKDHLNLILDRFPKIGIQISKEQKVKIYLELLTLYFFLISQQVGKYLHRDQFTLFVVKLHVELLDNLSRTRSTWWLFGINPFTRPKKIKEIVGEDSWKTTGLSSYIYKGERFYIQNKLNDEEIKAINDLKLISLGEHIKDYEKNLMIQFLIKISYLLAKILNLSLLENPGEVCALYSTNSFMISESQKQVFRNIKPVWHDKT